ncbi:MAG TPA: porin [Cyanobacteria bacterium UBA8803]|nr:porin [Cyanobacteria bacterium UBA9273]HBL59208.1 porin [Cyanobacteria bacterium UBA8803]
MSPDNDIAQSSATQTTNPLEVASPQQMPNPSAFQVTSGESLENSDPITETTGAIAPALEVAEVASQSSTQEPDEVVPIDNPYSATDWFQNSASQTAKQLDGVVSPQTASQSAEPVEPLDRLAGAEELPQTAIAETITPVSVLAQGVPSEGVTPQWDDLQPTETDPMGQVTNVSQLRDVLPGDWAYEALRSLVERYGCIAGYPDGTFRGNRAMTRYEFAAGLNACLQQIERLIGEVKPGITQEDLETLQRLTQEFAAEIASLTARVDNLEGRVAFLDDHQFSTTTKLFGQVVMGVQGRSENDFTLFVNRFEDRDTNVNLITNAQLSLFTQFSPRTLLLTGLQAGNGRTVSRGPALNNFVGLSYEADTNNDLRLSDLSYRQLIGNNFAFIVGPEGVNAVNVFRGTNRVESAGFGPLSRFAQRNPIIAIGAGSGGVGFDWQIGPRMSLQGVYSSSLPENAEFGGIFGGDFGETSAGAQLVVSPFNTFDIALQYVNSYSPFGRLGPRIGDDQLVIPSNPFTQRAPINTNAFGASLEWRLTRRFTIGGWAGYTTSDFTGGSGTVETFNWMAYLNFPDLLGEGNLAGIYVGQPPRITDSDVSVNGQGRNIPSFLTEGEVEAGDGGQPDTTTHVEAFYRFRVADNISITPGFILLFNPGHNSDNDTIFIGALRTTFTF